MDSHIQESSQSVERKGFCPTFPYLTEICIHHSFYEPSFFHKMEPVAKALYKICQGNILNNAVLYCWVSADSLVNRSPHQYKLTICCRYFAPWIINPSITRKLLYLEASSLSMLRVLSLLRTRGVSTSILNHFYIESHLMFE